MGRLTGLWWWIDRWRKSTAYIGMTLEQQAAYRNLLDEASLRGGAIPDDEEVLAKACGDPRKWRSVRAKVMAYFKLTADGWRNETLDEVLKESTRRATNQANYRKRRDNKNDNERGHEPDNDTDNNHDNDHDNKPDSPDPDPIVPSEQKKERDPRPRRIGPRTGLLKPNGNVAFEGPKVSMSWDVYYKLSKLRNNPNADNELRALFDRVSEEWTTGVRRNDEPGANQFRFWDDRYDEQWPRTKAAPTSRQSGQPAYSGWKCDHVEHCDNRAMCEVKQQLGPVKYPVKERSAAAR